MAATQFGFTSKIEFKIASPFQTDIRCHQIELSDTAYLIATVNVNSHKLWYAVESILTINCFAVDFYGFASASALTRDTT